MQNIENQAAGNAPSRLPAQRYGCVVADPPWPAQGGERHYDVMPIDRIKAMGSALVPHLAQDAVLWLWLTNATVEAGYSVARAWSFEPKSLLTWVKPRLGLGRPLRNMTEHALLAVRGKPDFGFHSQGTWLFAPVQDHSHKPEEFLEIVKRLGPNGRRLELFARRRHDGFDAWGNHPGLITDVVLDGFPVPGDRAHRTAEGGA